MASANFLNTKSQVAELKINTDKDAQSEVSLFCL